MKAGKPADIERALDRVDPAIRMYLLYGPDEAGSRALAMRLDKAMRGAERIDLNGAGLKVDPARLADEAAAMSLFGDRRYIRVEPAGDEMIAAAEALLECGEAGNPVVVVAGALRADAKLVKLATAHPAALAYASYPPEGDTLGQLALQLARSEGLRIAPDVAQRVAGSSGGDRAILAREIEKYAIFLDAAPDRPKDLDHADVDRLSADSDGVDIGALVNATFDGDLAALDDALAQADMVADGIPVFRALVKRVLLLAQLRGEVERGNTIKVVMAGAGKAVFWKEAPIVARQVSRWSSSALARAATRLGETQRRSMAAQSPGGVMLAQELVAVARQARRKA